MAPADTLKGRLEALEADERRFRLSPHRRQALVREGVAAARERRAWIFAPSRPVPLGIPGYGWVAAMAVAILIVGGGYLWSPAPAPAVPAAGSGSRDDLVLNVRQEGGDVVLEWQNGLRADYTVRQADSPKEVREAPGVRVQGNRFVDHSSTGSRIVYYLVE